MRPIEQKSDEAAMGIRSFYQSVAGVIKNASAALDLENIVLQFGPMPAALLIHVILHPPLPSPFFRRRSVEPH
jgi:hypothetical protein